MNDNLDNYQRSALNGLSAKFIDRAHHRRGDNAWIQGRLRDESTLFVLVRQGKQLFNGGESPHCVLLSGQDISNLGLDLDGAIFLGSDKLRSYFALDLTDLPPGPPEGIAVPGEFRDLRAMSPFLEPEESGLLAYARAITYWHRRHRFCGDCGSPTAPSSGGHVRLCTNPACAQHIFPRTDPAIIVLVASEDSCLLGRQAIWPKLRYSVIAGFVEPGETLEDAVAREVFEETGTRVQTVHYHSSQPWPFPCSIMLGFTATAQRGPIRLGDGELEDAQWFSRAELLSAVEQGKLLLPPPVSIAYRLLENWFDEGGSVRLRDLGRASWIPLPERSWGKTRP
jgi:NAD+ diphosphatase